MNNVYEPLINDEFTGQPPTKRLLAYLLSKKEKGAKIAGFYCGYAPVELIRAMGLVPAGLCAYSNATIEAAETVLPANLCPLIKSSYGFILKDTCPFFGISDAVIAETTCDGKKKMFELIADKRPMFVMDLPQLPDEPEAVDNWTVMIRKLQRFLEETFNTTADDDTIEAAIKDTNRKSRLMNRVFDYSALQPPLIGWKEMYDIFFLAQSASGAELEPLIEDVLAKLEERKRAGYVHGETGAPRVMVSGCPIAGDSAKVLSIIEEAGGVVVALDACSGMKCFMDTIEENTGDPLRAIAARYMRIPCSCMTPNNRRLKLMDRMIERFRPDAVIDVVLHACHSYNVESYRAGMNVQKKHGLPFLKIVTDYSDGDAGQVRTRIEAILETCHQ
ncbi:MAG: 2-hydroxyacyl-CoA dehydratase [Spirochaetes bacterium]|nr:2-hydroxyacyl-CoA dehydratase [Spirochaetota bacterium]